MFSLLEVIMEMIKGYESDSASSEASETQEHTGTEMPEVNRQEINARAVRKVYLITYSQADEARFPTRQSFVDAVVHSFYDTPAKIIQWCCSMERHLNSGIHYHMAVKLDKNQRWLSSKRFLLERCGISVHFSAIHANYFSAWQYVTKEDEDYIQSSGHPDLSNSNPPRTNRASFANSLAANSKQPKRGLNDDMGDEDDEFEHGKIDEIEAPTNSKSNKAKGKAKRKRMTSYELSEIILAKNIKSRTELLALAREQKQEGKIDLAEFIVNRGAKVVAEVLETTWEMENSKQQLDRQTKTRIELINEAKEGQCVEGCYGQWLTCAKEVLECNGIDAQYYGRSIQDLLEKGRGKYRNIMNIGVANCGKTFLLNPLNVIFNTFSNPACTSFAWVGAEKAECIFLNDFRWSPCIIPWHDLLLLLEGQLVHLPAPKSHYAKDIVFDKDTPIFATGKNEIIFVKSGAVDDKETEMMAVRWKIFRFHAQIPQQQQKEIPPCPKCFAILVLGGDSDDSVAEITSNHE